MVLVIGGFASGKRAYVQSEYFFSWQDMADAVLDDKPVLFNLQDLIARDPDAAETLLPKLLQKTIVICNEIGCGIVPASYADRHFRETVGRICVELARRADIVVRICSGIPVVIKG
jgi:adenosylcobinamide kinase/adenosylcobinamide-phosphate guanylyltransferase